MASWVFKKGVIRLGCRNKVGTRWSLTRGRTYDLLVCLGVRPDQMVS